MQQQVLLLIEDEDLGIWEVYYVDTIKPYILKLSTAAAAAPTAASKMTTQLIEHLCVKKLTKNQTEH